MADTVTGRIGFADRAGGPTDPSPSVSATGAHPLRGALQWYAVRVRPQQRQIQRKEYADNPLLAPFLVEDRLKAKGFATFVPRVAVYRKENRYTKEKVAKARPLLVGWMFVGIPEGLNRWRDLFDTPGVSGVAGAGGAAYVMSDARVQQLRDKWEGGFIKAHNRERFMRSRKEYGPGAEVRIAEGPMTNMTGKVVAVRGKHATVLLRLFGRESEVSVPAMLLEAA